MSKLIEFFSWVYKGIVNSLTVITSGLGLAITTITTAVTSVVGMYNNLTTANSALSSAVSGYEGFLNVVVNSLSSAPPIMKWLCYVLSFDVIAANVTLVLSVFLPLFVVVLTFFVVTVPVWLVSFYLLRFSVWLATAIFPKQYVPAILSSLSEAPVMSATFDGMGGSLGVFGNSFSDKDS